MISIGFINYLISAYPAALSMSISQWKNVNIPISCTKYMMLFSTSYGQTDATETVYGRYGRSQLLSSSTTHQRALAPADVPYVRALSDDKIETSKNIRKLHFLHQITNNFFVHAHVPNIFILTHFNWYATDGAMVFFPKCANIQKYCLVFEKV